MSDRQPRKRKLQFLLAGGVSAVLLTPLVAFGGVGFARSSPSAAQYEYSGGKTTLCHRTHSAKHAGVTITVGNPAVRAHLRHGDKLGPCAATAPSTPSPHGHDKGHGHGHGHGHGKP